MSLLNRSTATFWLAVVLSLAVSAFATLSFAQDLPGSKDHPMLKRFAGSSIVGYTQNNFDAIDLQSSSFTNYDLAASKRVYAKPTLRVEGKLTRLWYEAPGTTTSTELYRNYVNELTASGFTTLYDSTGDSQAKRWNNFLAPFSSQGDDAIKNNRSEYIFYAARTLSIRTGTFQKDNVYVRVITIDWGADDRTYKAKQGAYAAIDVVETKAMKQNMVVVSASEMSSAIANTGKIAIYGILFDTGKADVKSESKPSLDQIALFLKNDPAARLHVVGHTDSVGGLESNMALSKRRSEAIISVLARDHAVSPARLIANGVAHLAPVASNATEEGKAKNRRVELVLQ